MLKSYLTTALRALKRNWSYSVINVLGLTLSLACCLLLFLAIRYELSFDKHNAHANQTYRLVSYNKKSNEDRRNVGIPLPALAALRNDFPNLKQDVTMVNRITNVVVTVGEKSGVPAKKFQEGDGVVAFVEPEYFRLFDFGWKNGSPQTSLNNPNTVVLSEQMAQKYFGTSNPMGKTLRVENKMDFVVSGVVQNLPATTSMPFEVLLSFASLKQFGASTNWDDWQSTYGGAQIYLKLPGTADDQLIESAQMDKQLVAFVNKYQKPEDARDLVYALQPLTSIHTDTRTDNYAKRTVSMEMIWAMGLIGLFILITACVNFINLATAQAIRRAKEVGVRKVLGSSRGQLVRQFLGETGVLTGIAVILSFVLAQAALPYVGELLNIKPGAATLFDPTVIAFLITLGVLTTALAGFYPALVLSGYQPILALKGKIRSSGQGGINQLTLRRGLIVGQFAISQLLIIGTIIAYSQMKYFRSADLGYSRDAVLNVYIPEKKPGQLESLRAKLTGLPGIQSMSFGMTTPSSTSNWTTGFRFENDEKEPDYGVLMRPADTAYVHTYGLKIIAGRMYQPGDSMREFVINEAFMKRLGFQKPEQVIGKFMTVNGEEVKKPIVGVVKDFNAFSLHQQIEPSVLTSYRDQYRSMGIKLAQGQTSPEAISGLLKEVETAWNATFPDFVFKYTFLDETLANFYKSEERMYSLFRLLALIAIFIGCLGLYGVVAFMAETRTKEVGIRKALGASTAHIFGLFSIDFVKLVLVALVLSSPLAWYVMNQWLQKFAFKIDIEWWMFALAGLLAVSVALLTVSFQSIKAALMNPVKSLRSE
ncbi:FtsX-like permease family protein [Spirosoma sp. HMF3257]|uniref:ABC transporter permease n=1 Tax=Spirosoma telluris TaxID=2183553 RepID=A0A327NMW3_9BACT|nr:FtsX-like permease family protein [Spirosoma telluris]RAI75366.1 ABC transporter permease [Spirosoma telluris]